MNYPMYNNQFYLQDLQNRREMLDNQIKQYQQQNQYQMQQPVSQPQIHQSFQLAPQSNISEIQAKYVEDINEVKNTFVLNLGIFINKEMNTLWIKDISGNIRTFKTEEVIELDEKDKEIYMLKKQIEELKQYQTKGDVVNATQHINPVANETTSNEKSTRVQHNKYSNAK